MVSLTRSMPSRTKPGGQFRRSCSTGRCNRPTLSSVIMGAHNEEKLRRDLGAIGRSLMSEQVAMLAKPALAAPHPHFPYRRQEGFAPQSTHGKLDLLEARIVGAP